MAVDISPTRATPVLRLDRALIKLESLRPSAGVDDRALPLWDSLAEHRPLAGAAAAFAGTSGAALAGAGWARAHGVKLTAFLHGAVPHEARESLRIWGVPFEVMPSREAALQAAAGAATRGALLLPPLDGEEATHAVARTLGAELVRDLAEAGLAPAVLIAPAGAAAALLGTAAALRVRTPSLRVVALCAAAAQDELPELPLHPVFGDAARGAVELRPVTRGEAAHARADLSRRHGLLAGHAGAFAVQLARATDLPAGACAVALLTSAGEREFSLDVPAQAAVQP